MLEKIEYMELIIKLYLSAIDKNNYALTIIDRRLPSIINEKLLIYEAEY